MGWTRNEIPTRVGPRAHRANQIPAFGPAGPGTVNPRRVCLGFMTAVLLVASHPVAAQSLWLDRRDQPSAFLEVLKPIFGSEIDEFPTATVFLSFRIPASERTAVVTELPFAHFESPSDGSSSAIGNPYLGVDFHPPGSSSVWHVGVRAPLAPNDEVAVFSGFFSDLNRWEAFLPDLVTIQGSYEYAHLPDRGPSVRLRAGPALWLPTSEGDAELFALYGVLLGIRRPEIRLEGGVGGRLFVTAEGDFFDRVDHQFELVTDFGTGSLRPGLSLRVPLEGEEDPTDLVVGATLNVGF